MAAATEIIGDRWTLLILREAFYGVVRYDDIREDLGISRSILTDRLGKLVKRELLKKRPYREGNDRERFAYVLTDRGREFAIVILALLQWGNADVVPEARRRITSRQTSERLHVAVVDSDGREVPLTNVELTTG